MDEEEIYSDSDFETEFADADFNLGLPKIGLELGFDSVGVTSIIAASTLEKVFPNSRAGLSSMNSFDSDNSSTASTSSTSKNKYLYPQTDTVEQLRPEEIRWFYKEITDKKWTPFIGYDSLRIECKYREILQWEGSEAKSAASDDERIIVRGGLFEVDVAQRLCYPIYWSYKGEETKVQRGVWFLDHSWQPLDESYSIQIEVEHLAKFENRKLAEEPNESGKGPTPILHNIKFREFHVDWNAVNKVFLHHESASSKFYRAVGHKLGLSKAGTRIHRAYKHEATMEDKPADICHLVFVVHGIGQKMETGSIVKCCKDLRQTCSRIKDKHFPQLDLNNKRVEFFPVEWRSDLKLDGGIVDTITPNKVLGLRTMLNSSAMDILYYTSPLYRSEITQGLQIQLNRLYSMFCDRHPYFESSGGKVSIVAHSLGCVITYDIITGWNPIQLYDQYVSSVIKSSAIIGSQMYFSFQHSLSVEEKIHQLDDASELVSDLEAARKRVSELESEILKRAAKQHMKSPTLKFKLENFFCLGSPLSVFLALRGVRPNASMTLDNVLPVRICRRLYNMYHPSDPVAYRLEPLIQKHYSLVKPVRIHRSDLAQKHPYHNDPSDVLAEVRESLKSHETTTDDVKKEKTEKKEKAKEEESSGKNEENAKANKDNSKKQTVSWNFVFKRNQKNTKKEEANSCVDGIEEKQTENIEARGSDTEDEADTATLQSSTEEKDVTMEARTPSPGSIADIIDEEDKPSPDSQTPASGADDAVWPSGPDEGGPSNGADEGGPSNGGDEGAQPDEGAPPSDHVSNPGDLHVLEHRLDYQLRAGKMENAYIAALTSHTSYWTQPDVALFIMTHVFPDQ